MSVIIITQMISLSKFIHDIHNKLLIYLKVAEKQCIYFGDLFQMSTNIWIMDITIMDLYLEKPASS